MEYVLETAALCKRYGRFEALRSLTMSVPRGAIYGLIGKNGAGKSTLLRLVCGLQAPTDGSYRLYGTDARDRAIAKARAHMGAVVETPALYLDMSAADNLREQALALGLPDGGDIPALLRLVGLGNVGKKRVRHFSLGMRQRLGIAVALMGHPDFLILDEPLNGLDPQGILEMRELILTLNRERGIEPNITMPEKAVWCSLDRNAAVRVAENLLSNAVKYSGGDLTVRLTSAGELTLENAAQLTQSEVQRLFERFYTVDACARSTGLGLSVAKLLTEKMGGAVSAACENGRLILRVKFLPVKE